MKLDVKILMFMAFTPSKMNGWNPNMEVWKMIFLFNWVIFRFNMFIFLRVCSLSWSISICCKAIFGSWMMVMLGAIFFKGWGTHP